MNDELYLHLSTVPGYRTHGVLPQRSILYSERAVPPRTTSSPAAAKSPSRSRPRRHKPRTPSSSSEDPPPLLPRASHRNSAAPGSSHSNSGLPGSGPAPTGSSAHLGDHAHSSSAHPGQKRSRPGSVCKVHGPQGKQNVAKPGNVAVEQQQQGLNDSFHSNQVQYIDGYCSKDVLV